MKKISLLVILTFLASRLFASHLIGGELRYDYNGTNYTINIVLYTTCSIPPSITMAYQYTSTAYAGTTRTAPLQSVDTLSSMYCPTAGASCSGSYPIYIRATYTDTLTLPPASDWVISCYPSDLSSTIVNLSSPGSYSMYLSAGLNNSTRENNSALMANNPPFLLSRNAVNKIGVDAVDADNDSIVRQMIQPQSSTGGTPSNIPYASGYMLSAPLGTGSSTSFYGNSLLITTNNTVGIFALTMKTLEYSGGTLVGYSTRQWASTATPSAQPKEPYLYTEYTYPTVPGYADSAIVSFLDSTSTDSIFVDFATTNGWTYTITSTPGLGYATAKIKWTTPSGVSPATYPFFYIYARAYDHSCPYAAETWVPLCIHLTYPNDSVWPGDANADHTANIYDALAVAIAYGKTGPSRVGATTSWVGQYCAPWSYIFSWGVNMNKADCDGNGVVNISDLSPILLNYGMTHPRGGWTNTARITGLPDLYFDMTGITLKPGNTVTVPVKLGNSSVPVSKLYGLAGSMVISGIVPATDPTVANPATTWLGTTANTISFTKAINTNKIDFAYARNNQTNSNGQGTIANITFTVPSTATVGTQVILSFSGMKMIDSAGNAITSGFNVLSDTSAVTTDVPNLNSVVQNAMVIPNPSVGYANLKFTLSNDAALQIKITDLVGKTVWQQNDKYISGTHTVFIPSNTLAPGMYMVHIESEGWQYPVMKWVKE